MALMTVWQFRELYVDGRRVQGLVNRREAEFRLCMGLE